jgi:hypothetical protein
MDALRPLLIGGLVVTIVPKTPHLARSLLHRDVQAYASASEIGGPTTRSP